MPKLILKFGPAVIKEYPVDKDIITIGRKPDNDLVIEHQAVSGHHARLLKQAGMYMIEDLSSTNGTFVNGKKILNAYLRSGNEVLVATHTLVFIDDAQPAGEVAAVSEQSVAAAVPTPPPPRPSVPPPVPPAPAARTSVPAEPVTAVAGAGKALIRIVEGIVDITEFKLTGSLTYIGTNEQAVIKIKGGLFAPPLAAAIIKRPEGFLFKAIKEGYPKVNGKTVKDEQILASGDMIECGSTKMTFMEKE
ncbi:MAG: FHA domain-containing protein [Elusimicrobiota bacterium]